MALKCDSSPATSGGSNKLFSNSNVSTNFIVPDQHRTQVLKQIITQHIGGEVVDVESMKGGYVGSVYKVRITHMPHVVVVKIVEQRHNEDVINIDDQVFGSRFSNFQGAYALLVGAQFPLPTIYGYGRVDEEDIEYVVMDYLDGDDIRAVLAHGLGELTSLHQQVGALMGRMHCITSPIQGFIGKEVSTTDTWNKTFFTSLNNRLQMVCSNAMIQPHLESITRFIDAKKEEWVAPHAFVLTHGDGLQVIAKLEGDTWRIVGIVDIEDYFYTDQRFAIAGHSLALEYELRTLPDAFWQEYEKHCRVDPSYATLAPVFKLYHLLSWLPVADNPSHVPPEDQLKVRTRIETMISNLVGVSVC